MTAIISRSGRKSNKILTHYMLDAGVPLEYRLTERGVKSRYGEDLLSDSTLLKSELY